MPWHMYIAPELIQGVHAGYPAMRWNPSTVCHPLEMCLTLSVLRAEKLISDQGGGYSVRVCSWGGNEESDKKPFHIVKNGRRSRGAW